MTKRAKKKKNVDTKASKGRKIRYHVHEKLMNFMAPVPVATWHNDMVNELFVGLFGGVTAEGAAAARNNKQKQKREAAGSMWNGLGEITVLR
jgi:protein AATF/BFR2